MKHWEITDTGLIRHENQDAFGFAQLPGGYAVAVVCDGMAAWPGAASPAPWRWRPLSAP